MTAPIAAINSFDTNSIDSRSELHHIQTIVNSKTQIFEKSDSEVSINYARDGPSIAGFANVFATAVNTVSSLKPLPILKANIFNKSGNCCATAKYQKIQDEYFKLVKRAILLVITGVSIVVVGCVETYFYRGVWRAVFPYFGRCFCVFTGFDVF